MFNKEKKTLIYSESSKGVLDLLNIYQAAMTIMQKSTLALKRISADSFLQGCALMRSCNEGHTHAHTHEHTEKAFTLLYPKKGLDLHPVQETPCTHADQQTLAHPVRQNIQTLHKY